MTRMVEDSEEAYYRGTGLILSITFRDYKVTRVFRVFRSFEMP
jgi:hypothetical protein